MNDKGLEKKALQLLDNASSHRSSSVLQSYNGMIKTMFLPRNTTAIIQPMDQAVLDPRKHWYKGKLLAHILLENESTDKPVPEILKAITMKDVVYWIAAAWEEASPKSLHKAWRILLHESDPDDGVSDSDVSLDSSIADTVLTTAPLGKDK